VTGRPIASGQGGRFARAVAADKRPADAAGEGKARPGARAVGPAGAAERVFAGPTESPGARCEDLWARNRSGEQQGCGAGRAADGCAGIRRARSWAPRVRPSHRRPPDLDWYRTGPVSVQYRLACRLRLLLISCKLSAASSRCAAVSSVISTPGRWAIAAALLPRLIASCGAGTTVVCRQSKSVSE
jgi:hypothetical protein